MRPQNTFHVKSLEGCCCRSLPSRLLNPCVQNPGRGAHLRAQAQPNVDMIRKGYARPASGPTVPDERYAGQARSRQQAREQQVHLIQWPLWPAQLGGTYPHHEPQERQRLGTEQASQHRITRLLTAGQENLIVWRPWHLLCDSNMIEHVKVDLTNFLQASAPHLSSNYEGSLRILVSHS